MQTFRKLPINAPNTAATVIGYHAVMRVARRRALARPAMGTKATLAKDGRGLHRRSSAGSLSDRRERESARQPERGPANQSVVRCAAPSRRDVVARGR